MIELERGLEPLVRLLEAHETGDPEKVAQIYDRWRAAGEENTNALKVLAHRPRTLELYVKLMGRCFSGEVIEARLAEMIRLRGAQVATCAL
jgi:alkylhydroperoxidase family enzyme